MTDDRRRETLPVPAERAGARLDRWLADQLPDLSRARLQALIAEGRVAQAERTITDASARVKPGQVFTVAVPAPRPAQPRPQAMDLAVLYEDEDLIVLEKPPGLVVHPAPGNPDRTLVNALLAHCGDGLSGIGGVKRPGIVHRLDKDTSGLMVAAKTDAAHAALSLQFAQHTIERAYRALVWGVPRPSQGVIAGAIGRSPANRKKMAVVTRGGKPARTRYRVIKSWAQAVSLVECVLETGRTHQVRVHLAHLGHPLIGDPLYGRSRSSRQTTALPAAALAALRAFPRQALHAFRLGFTHPTTKKLKSFQTEIYIDINVLLKLLDSD